MSPLLIRLATARRGASTRPAGAGQSAEAHCHSGICLAGELSSSASSSGRVGPARASSALIAWPPKAAATAEFSETETDEFATGGGGGGPPNAAFARCAKSKCSCCAVMPLAFAHVRMCAMRCFAVSCTNDMLHIAHALAEFTAGVLAAPDFKCGRPRSRLPAAVPFATRASSGSALSRQAVTCACRLATGRRSKSRPQSWQRSSSLLGAVRGAAPASNRSASASSKRPGSP
mmetsp:Transcript_48412/g.111189  ORF Transcript_48412/g.111189 Transcript_48412/m.111189 type:complete len:232 (+) Transcript_48412:520-1215(+)